MRLGELRGEGGTDLRGCRTLVGGRRGRGIFDKCLLGGISLAMADGAEITDWRLGGLPGSAIFFLVTHARWAEERFFFF